MDRVYTLEDLQRNRFSGNSLAVVGHPITHSISPAMHNAAIARLSEKDVRFNDWKYHRFDIPTEDLEEALGLFHENYFIGLNLTVPHKVQAMGLIARMAPELRLMGACNTLVWKKQGYHGFNTDGYGLKAGLLRDFGLRLKHTTVILLGAGGAARAAAVQCILEGCEKLYVINRRPDRLKKLEQVVESMPTGKRAEFFCSSHWLQAHLNLPPKGILINATSVGMKADDPAPFEVAGLPKGWKVYDMVYNPEVHASPKERDLREADTNGLAGQGLTQLLKDASGEGLAVANGLSMLVHQGARSLEIWSGTSVDYKVMTEAAHKALQRKSQE